MIVDKITDHVAQTMGRMMNEYSALPQRFSVSLPTTGTTIETSVIGAVLALLVDQIQELENVTHSIDKSRMWFNGTIFGATGAQLDGVGEIVDVARNGNTDAVYSLLIAAKIAEHYSTGTVEELLYLVTLLYGAPFVQMFENYPGEVSFYLTSSLLDPSLYSFAQTIVSSAMSAGVRLGFISITASANVFQCGYIDITKEPPEQVQIGAGCGDVNDAGTLILATTATASSGSNVLTGLGSIVGVVDGMIVTGSKFPRCFVQSFVSLPVPIVYLTENATSSGSTTANFNTAAIGGGFAAIIV